MGWTASCVAASGLWVAVVLATRVVAGPAEDVAARVDGTQPLERSLESGRQRIVGAVHVGEHGVAAPAWNLEGIQQRAERGRIVVGVVGMPAAADVGLMLRLLQHHRHARLLRDGGEEAVDVDRAEPARRGQLAVRRQFLVAEEHHAMLRLRGRHRVHLGLGERIEVDVDHESAASTVRRFDFHLKTPAATTWRTRMPQRWRRL